MEEVRTITLEDNEEYVIVDEINYKDEKYIYLVNEQKIEKVCIRKINIINGKECLIGLDNENEFKLALNEYIKKHRNN